MKNDPYIIVRQDELTPTVVEIYNLGEHQEISCKSRKKKCCKKFKKGDQCRRCPKIAAFQKAIDQWYLVDASR